ncbi:potassium channel family protein [Polymorphobacter fuscus]|uniref:Potassium transporter TrkA n=1 Tax=Sandarakinorhabdus fusca TaxID=1439888 RepID=A0A7C9KH82_9SPHN|nr:potassium channel family protein [Polymorphobacter fuscus]KAB7648700.1 potassium channel family protein [Polymorphobacter fuscus]MQT16261.1 potassium transporter TrkA [Polymorphobacter fuscus]NJC07454.1 voltage-gated potassium channel [Polymorphobacter fuscus]
MTASTPWLRLQRPDVLGPGASLGLRALLVLALIGIALAGHWFDRGGLRDNIDNHVSFVDVVYFTAITVATVGYGDIVPVTDQARLFDTFVVTPIRLFIWLIFLGTAYDFIFKRIWDRWRMQNIQRQLHGHCIVCGYGSSGEATIGELIRGGSEPLQIVVIDKDPERVAKAVACGVTGLTGDASHNEVLSAARVETACAVLVCTGRDDTAALVVLSARKLAPGAHVSAIVKSAENEALMRQAGANVVVNPVDLGGHLLARATGSAHVVDYVTDLVTNMGRVCLQERSVTASEVGKSMADVTTGLGVRIHRGSGVIGFWEDGARSLQRGDLIVEIVPTGR